MVFRYLQCREFTAVQRLYFWMVCILGVLLIFPMGDSEQKRLLDDGVFESALTVDFVRPLISSDDAIYSREVVVAVPCN